MESLYPTVVRDKCNNARLDRVCNYLPAPRSIGLLQDQYAPVPHLIPRPGISNPNSASLLITAAGALCISGFKKIDDQESGARIRRLG